MTEPDDVSVGEKDGDTAKAMQALRDAEMVEGEKAEKSLDALAAGEATIKAVNTRAPAPGREGGLTAEQHDYLLNPLRGARVAKRSQGGKSLSYLEAWDVKAHLTRVFGFANWDSEVVEAYALPVREYKSSGTPARDMLEVMWFARLTLSIRDQWGYPLATYSEGAVGSATGGAGGAGVGDLHDNAMKQAASDALKRCAINLGTQFGLSLYDDGAVNDVVRVTLVRPDGAKKGLPPTAAVTTDEAKAALEKSVGLK